MTHEERVAEIKGRFGFTERQAGFLVTVMLHAGVCLGRQYCAFARIKYGEPMRTFFQTLEARRFVTPQTCAHGRARLFHVHYKPLYAAIGEPDNRFRRPMTLARAIERLMVLDAVLADPNLTWLATEREKVAHFTGAGVMRHHLPALTFRSADEETVRYSRTSSQLASGEMVSHTSFCTSSPAGRRSTSACSSSGTQSCCAACRRGLSGCSFHVT